MIIMKDDGSFIESKLIKGMDIGHEVSIAESSRMYKTLYKYSLIAATFTLFFLGGIQVKSYYTPYGSINIDINPSIEVKYNKFERCLGAQGLNDDGQKVVFETGNVTHNRLEDVVRNLVDTASKDNYLKDNEENQILLSTYSPDTKKSNNVIEKINNSLNLYLNKQTKKTEIINEIISKDDIDKAILQKMSVGKLKLYEKAKITDPNITIEDIKSKPVREIVKSMREKQKEKENSKNANKQVIKQKNTDEKLIQPDKPTVPILNDENNEKNDVKQAPETQTQKVFKNNGQSNNQQNIIIGQKPNKIPNIEVGKNAKDSIDRIRKRVKEINDKNSLQ